MRTIVSSGCRSLFHAALAVSEVAFLALALGLATPALAAAPAKAAPIPMEQIGAVAGKQYQGDGLSVTATPQGARLRCVFQKLEGEATARGLWLTSTTDASKGERFRVVASAVGRSVETERGHSCPPLAPSLPMRTGMSALLPRTGTVEVVGQVARFIRPGLTEEYSVSMDGIRQDFLIERPPLNPQPSTLNRLRVELEVSGARVEGLANGARLVLERSGRKLAYSRPRATDARGKELPARIEVPDNSAFRTPHSEMTLAVVVDDAGAEYPVRIDPTFSDENWISLNPSLPGTDGTVHAAAVDEAGNLYMGGDFGIVGNVLATNIAKWNGSSWSALGSGLNGVVRALAVSGSDLYAGGGFTTAGGSVANYIAKWNGSSWSALGSGMGGYVYALAVSDSDVYAGGGFTTAGGSPASRMAKWNGSSWSALGSGVNGGVFALALSGSDVYVGGWFTTAGGNPATNIAKWDGSSWSALGSGMNDRVWALAASGSDVYAGGNFWTAGGSPANRIAKWNGSSWSALGSGMNDGVVALAVFGSDLYAGGGFTTAGGSPANYIAQWDGSSWAALGSGMNEAVVALAVSGGGVYGGAISRLQGAARPTTLPNGTGVVGRRWRQGWAAA